jgi:hypothetical protein
VLSNHIFCFEELENNLHPAMQKRFFGYLRNVALEKKCTLFITTHSHIVIDLFSREPEAQLIHVKNDGQSGRLARADRVTSRTHHGSVFNDLGVRASDLLQSNCILWVEGPSDRIYVNKWIELFDPELKEHDHFEFAFTSGTLLSHIAYDDPKGGDRIEALRINRNAIILMDRDAAATPSGLKPRVERVSSEMRSHGGLAWITKGREVENYIPVEALRLFLEEPELAPQEEDVSVFELIRDSGKGSFSDRKPELAVKICECLEPAMLDGCLDLKDRLKEVCLLIRKWNSREKSDTDPAQ